MKRNKIYMLLLILSVIFSSCGREVKTSFRSIENKVETDPSVDTRSLIKAIKDGDEKTTIHLINQNANIYERDIDDNSPLLLSIQYGLNQVCILLINKGVDLYYKNPKGESPLYLAWFYKRKPILDLLLEKIDLVLMDAIEMNNNDFMRLLIDKHADLNQVDDLGNTVLMMAIREGNINLAKMLIESGANFQLKNADGDTALHFAGKAFDIEITRILLKSGANPREKNNQGESFKHIWKNKIKECRDDVKRNEALLIFKRI